MNIKTYNLIKQIELDSPITILSKTGNRYEGILVSPESEEDEYISLIKKIENTIVYVVVLVSEIESIIFTQQGS